MVFWIYFKMIFFVFSNSPVYDTIMKHNYFDFSTRTLLPLQTMFAELRVATSASTGINDVFWTLLGSHKPVTHDMYCIFLDCIKFFKELQSLGAAVP